MILKTKVVRCVPSGTQIILNIQGRILFQNEPWANCIGIISKVSRDGFSAKIKFPGVKESPTTIHRRYLEKKL